MLKISLEAKHLEQAFKVTKCSVTAIITHTSTTTVEEGPNYFSSHWSTVVP